MIINLDYQLGGNELTDLIIKCNISHNITDLKKDYKQKLFTKEDGDIIRLDIPKLDDVGDKWRGMLKIPVFHFYHQLYFQSSPIKYGFLIDNCFKNNLPNSIKSIIGDNENIKIYFSPQSNQDNLVNMLSQAFVVVKNDPFVINQLGGDGHLLFRPHYVYIPHPNDPTKKGLVDNVDNINIRSKVQIFPPNGVTCSTTPNIISNFATPNGLLTHGSRISTQDPKLVGLSNKTESAFYSIFNSINGDNSEFHITLHWMLSRNNVDILKAHFLRSNNFEELLNELQTNNNTNWNELKQSLINLLA